MLVTFEKDLLIQLPSFLNLLLTAVTEKLLRQLSKEKYTYSYLINNQYTNVATSLFSNQLSFYYTNII